MVIHAIIITQANYSTERKFIMKRVRKNHLKDNPILLAFKIAMIFMFVVLPIASWQAGWKTVWNTRTKRPEKNKN